MKMQLITQNWDSVESDAFIIPMVVKLVDGEEIHGVIEWYDRKCIKVNRSTEPNLLIPKRVIKYIYKENEVKGSDEYQVNTFTHES